jgi:hypothetical protein
MLAHEDLGGKISFQASDDPMQYLSAAIKAGIRIFVYYLRSEIKAQAVKVEFT